MVLAFVNTFSHSRKLVTSALAARTSNFRLNNVRAASSSGIRIPGVSGKNLFYSEKLKMNEN